MLIEERIDALGLRIEQEASDNRLPCHIVLHRLMLNDLKEDLKITFKLDQTIIAEVWHQVVD